MEYYKVHRVMTGKPMGRSDEDYSRFDEDDQLFETLDEAKQFIKDTYGASKRQAMYQDNGANQIGWVIHFKNADYSHAPTNKWYQLDWVTITHVTENHIVS